MRTLVDVAVVIRTSIATIAKAATPAAYRKSSWYIAETGVDSAWEMAAMMGGILSTMIAIPLTPLEYSAIYSKGLVIYIPLYPSPVRVRANKAATVANRQTVRGFQM